MNKKTNVLIVDDDIQFAQTLSKILKAKGYDTKDAKDGFEALDLIDSTEFDIVLMDIKMPVINGVETYKKMKEIKPETIVILMTAFSLDDLIKEALKEGVYAVVHKPLDIEMTIQLIEKSKDGLFINIVDDDENICKTMEKVLMQKGYSVTTCTSGEEAIQLAKEKPHDVIFIDMQLPALNGLETYLTIQKTNPEAIVVMMTAYRCEMDELIQQALEKGAYACLYKPFDLETVIKMLEKIHAKKEKH